jgi:hypothetical protein
MNEQILSKNAKIVGRKGQQFELNCNQIVQAIFELVQLFNVTTPV